MIRVNIKPLSINECFQGRRFKSHKYIDYETEMLWTLPGVGVAVYDKMWIKIKVGFSSKRSDLDNFLKPFLDILQKRYNFNDADIYKLELEKVVVDKGKEFMEFEIKPCI